MLLWWSLRGAASPLRDATGAPAAAARALRAEERLDLVRAREAWIARQT